MLITRTFFFTEVKRQLRNPYTLAFTLVMPLVLYLMFGVSADYAKLSTGHGNASFYVMASMASFGAATAMSSMCSRAASEVSQGWGRQIALTPLPMSGYAVTKLLTAVSLSAISVTAVFLLGVFTGATAEDLWRWFATAGLILVLSCMFGLFGLGVGLAFSPDSAAALASISITFFSFFGNLFMPLSGVMLDIARFTPLYGYAALVRWPVTGGALTGGGSDPLWAVILSIVVWTAIFGVLTRVGAYRARQRH